MPEPTTALFVAGSQLVGSAMQSRAASKAAGAQVEAAQMGIAEQQRQFDEMTKLLSPYVQAGGAAMAGLAPYTQAGERAFEQQQALLGLRGPEAEQAAIAALERRPGFQAQVQKGEEALLARASATGGLRGGNIQAALAQFRPAMLAREIESQYGRLGGLAGAGLGVQQYLTGVGQAAAARQAASGMGLGESISGLLGQQGAARAGSEIAQGRAFGGLFNLPGQFVGYQMATGQVPSFGSIFGQQPPAPIIERGEYLGGNMPTPFGLPPGGV